ncbi:hypothetical protein Hanom_Chr07g00613441 [Helianthus anomalus]
MCKLYTMAEQQQINGAQPAAAAAPAVPVRPFVPKHNQIAILDEAIHGAAYYAPIIHFLRRSRISYAISEDVQLVITYIDEFWQSAISVDNTIEATINGNQIIITEDVIRAALRFDDLDHGRTSYSRTIRERAARAFGYVGQFPSKQLLKGMIIGQWRYFFHVLMQCLAPRKAGMDGMGHSLLSGMICLTFNQPFNFSLMILQSFRSQLGFCANDKRLQLLYPHFLTLIFRHLLPNLPFGDHLPAYALTPMHRRIFKDCRNPKETVHATALLVVHPLLGAMVQEVGYNPESDQTWINIRNGVAQLFDADVDVAVPRQPVMVVKPQVDLQQPPPIMNEPVIEESVVGFRVVEDVSVSQPIDVIPSSSEMVDLVTGDRVDMVLEQVVTSIGTSAPISLAETDPIILALDAALETGSSSNILDKGKGVVVGSVEDSVDDTLTRNEYLELVHKDMLNKISQSDKEKFDLFRAIVASLGPSSGWAVGFSLPARVYKRRKVISSYSSSFHSSCSLPVVTTAIPVVSVAVPVDTTRVASSISAFLLVSSSPIPSAPLFSFLRASMSPSNMCTISESASLSSLPSDFFSSLQVIQCPSGPRMIMPTSATCVASSSGGRPKTALGSRPPTSSPRPRGTASGNGAQSFPEFVRQQFADVHSVMKEHRDLIQLHRREIAYWKWKDELKSKQVTHVFSLTKEQGSQLRQFNRKDAVTSAKHENLINELKKIRDNFDKDKDPEVARQGEQPRSSQASETATIAQVEGESGSGATAGQDMGPSAADDSGSLSDPDDHDDHELSSNVFLDEGDVLIGQVEEWRTDDEIADKFSYVETCKGKNIEYDSVGAVTMNDLRNYVFGDASPDKITDPIQIPKEIRLASHKWSWAKYLQTLHARDLHHLAQLDLNNHTNVACIRGLIPNLVAESCESKWKIFKPAVGRAVKTRDKFTGKQVLKMVYPPARCLRKIPMRKFDLDKIQGIGDWYYDGKTGEAVITRKKMTEKILRILDPVWLINLKMEHLKVLHRLSLH